MRCIYAYIYALDFRGPRKTAKFIAIDGLIGLRRRFIEVWMCAEIYCLPFVFEKLEFPTLVYVLLRSGKARGKCLERKQNMQLCIYWLVKNGQIVQKLFFQKIYCTLSTTSQYLFI